MPSIFILHMSIWFQRTQLRITDITTLETDTADITIHIHTVTTTHILSATTIIAEVVEVVVICVQIEMMFTEFLLARRNKINKKVGQFDQPFYFTRTISLLLKSNSTLSKCLKKFCPISLCVFDLFDVSKTTSMLLTFIPPITTDFILYFGF